MFRSSENLRLAADMRALERVARPWREVRASWFDGTPESIEARLASTERVLTFAKAGVTEAHIALEREAAAARAELKEASHRLLVDFLDDGARAFKGSKRVAGDGDPMLDHQNAMDSARGDQDYRDFMHQHLKDTGPGAHESTCSECGEPVAEDSEYGSYFHLDENGDPDHQDRGHYADPDHFPVDDHRHGSRVAKERGLRECINCGGSLSGEEGDDPEAECLTCGMSAHEKGVDWNKKGSYRTAGDGPGSFLHPTVDDMFAQQDAARRYPEEQRARANRGFLEEMDPEDRPGYGEVDTGDCQHCGERIEDYGNGWEHPDGYLPSYGDHQAVPYDDEEGDVPPRTGSHRTANAGLKDI